MAASLWQKKMLKHTLEATKQQTNLEQPKKQMTGSSCRRAKKKTTRKLVKNISK